ncbi:M16 family metallopeptidase [Olivibacter sitiensis]|uniref:M16 family metallopeptidase n=1 Tax=Olivibacter sitiensis TaxID=376470 RepID=UPI00042416BA|nr:pitrilysin family protein [Olivibacter sitiensis]
MDRSIAPDYNEIDRFDLISPQYERWANGMDVFVFDGGEQELLRIEWIFENHYLEGKSPIVNLALSSQLLEGTHSMSSAEIAEKVDFYGAFLRPEYSFDHTSLVLFTLTKHLGKVLPIVREVLQQAVFPENELQTYIRNNKHSLGISLRKNDFVARRLFNKAIFGSDPYGFAPVESDFDTLRREDLQRLYQQQLCPANCKLFVAGKIAREVMPLVRDHFDDLWGGKTMLPSRSQVAERSFLHSVDAGKLIYEEREGALQSAIRLGSLFIKRSHPDFPAVQLLNTILGGYFGSRLMTNIREDKGYTYGIGSGIGSLQHAAFFTIATEVGVEVVGPTLKEIEKEIKRLKEEPLEADELSLVKNYINGTILGSLENVFSHADKFKQVYFQGLDNSYYDYNFQVLRNSIPMDVMETANKYLDFDKMVKVIVGKY